MPALTMPRINATILAIFLTAQVFPKLSEHVKTNLCGYFGSSFLAVRVAINTYLTVALIALTIVLIVLTIVLARDARRLDVLTHSLIGQPSSLPPEQSPTPTPTTEPVLKAIPIATPTPNPTPSPSPQPAGTRHRHSRRHR